MGGTGSYGAAASSNGRVEHSEEQSRAVMHRHMETAGPDPNLLLYFVSDIPTPRGGPPSPPKPGERRRVQCASHVPPNTLTGVPIETDGFMGQMLVMYRQGKSGGHNNPHTAYFSRRKRNWEIRVQGRFKRRPQGDIYIGIVLRDFNYNQAVARHSMIVKRAGMALVKYDLYLSWGDRCEASKKPDAELSHLVTGLSAWDQIIVTPKGRMPPVLSSDFQGIGDTHGRNLERAKMGLAAYSEAVDELFEEVSLEDTYTMCFWGVSQVIDLLSWQFRIGYNIDMARFFEDSPIHVAMYELSRSEGDEEKRHLESRKRYILDLMFWSSTVQCPSLPSHYIFRDAPEDLETFAQGVNGWRSAPGTVEPSNGSIMRTHSNGNDSDGSFHSLNSGPSSSGGLGRSLLSAVSRRLRWIPDFTCSAHDHHRDRDQGAPIAARKTF